MTWFLSLLKPVACSFECTVCVYDNCNTYFYLIWNLNKLPFFTALAIMFWSTLWSLDRDTIRWSLRGSVLYFTVQFIGKFLWKIYFFFWMINLRCCPNCFAVFCSGCFKFFKKMFYSSSETCFFQIHYKKCCAHCSSIFL